MDTRNIKLTCIECHRTNSVPYGRGHRICGICSQRELKRERRKQTQRRIQTLGGFVLVVGAVWFSCLVASDWNTPNSADHRAHQAMQARD
jgi:predicted nucleic acid-binding Zn ribbon protein